MKGQGERPSAPILIVDDRPENLVALEAILQPLEHPLVRANSGEEALRAVLRRDFSVILLDVQMPGMNGFETAELIKSREKSRHTPIIFLTAISKDEEYVFEGYLAGAVDYMFKPFNPDILRSKVSVFIDLYLKGVQLRQQGELLREIERRDMELRHQGQLLESDARYEGVVDSALEAIITFGEDRRVTLFNTSAEQIFLCDQTDALGSAVDTLFDTELELPEAPAEGSDERTPRQGFTTRDAVAVRCDGERFSAEFSLSVLLLRGEPVYTLVLRDISKRRRAEEELREKAVSLATTTEELRIINEELNHRTVELERAMGARSRFYANMSHELRTPINAILGYTSLLLDSIYGTINEKQTKALDRTHKAGNHLLELVNDILDLSKIEAGKMELQMESMAFPESVNDLFVTVAPFAEEHGVTLTLETVGEPFSIVTDARRVRQILLNLLSNAIKFGEGKPVRVVVGRLEDGGLQVEVVDEGIGIAEEDRDRVFEEFVQLGQDRESQGTGLG
ncbi:MAG: response regulator, partial [Gemmatimonadota bacterium]|nr:response regulator [Gemmatimonadota bacterium]